MSLIAMAAAGTGALAAPSRTTLASGVLRVSIDAAGRYNVSVDGRDWFSSGDVMPLLALAPLQLRFADCACGSRQTYFSDNGHTYSALAGNISVVSSEQDSGADAAGSFRRVSLDWALTTGASSRRAVWRTSFTAYDNRSALTFAQTFLKAMGGSAASGSRFPALRAVDAGLAATLGTLEYQGSSCGFMVGAHRSFPGIKGGKSKGMVAIVPKAGADIAGSALAIGPVREMFVNQASQAQDGALGYGVSASFAELPPGFAIETALVASSSAPGFASPRSHAPERASIVAGGVNAALAEYGDFILGRHRKARPLGNHTREASHLGYSTTGYYFYNLCDCRDEMRETHTRTSCSPAGSAIPNCSSYQDTLEAVHDGLVAQGVPYGHMLLDSWWYGEAIYGGAAMWEDAPFVRNISFPRGLHAFRQYIGNEKTIWAHNGKWTNTPYANDYPFTPDASLPQGDALWQHLFRANHEGWGLSTIKQDHMGENMGACETAYTNVSVLTSWLEGMAKGAADNGVGVLYCCAPPAVHMFGATLPAAYAVRASPDYVWQSNGRVLKLPQLQWALGPDNAFHWLANGLLPYKDTFFSNSTMAQTRPAGYDKSQWPPFYEYRESDASTHALMALLSLGPVTFSDAVGATNRTLVMQTCREDGVLLKPDRPATALDAQFHAMMFGEWPSGVAVPDAAGGVGAGGGGEREGPELAALAALDDEEALAEATATLSPSYAASTRVSARFVAALARRSQQRKSTCAAPAESPPPPPAKTRTTTTLRRVGSDEQCDVDRLASPQGPLGEAYSTHATVGGATWFYVVGVQIAQDIRVGPSQLLGSAAAQKCEHVTVSWRDPDGFRPTTRAEIQPFDEQHPVVLRARPASAIGQRNASLYAAQHHAVAPVLSNGWAVVGEAHKFLPMAGQRVVAVDTSSSDRVALTVAGAPGEKVAFTFVHVADAAAGPLTVECVIGPRGGAVVVGGGAEDGAGACR